MIKHQYDFREVMHILQELPATPIESCRYTGIHLTEFSYFHSDLMTLCLFPPLSSRVYNLLNVSVGPT